MPRGLPAAKNRPNGAARVPVGHGRPPGARACPPGTRGSTLSLGAAAGHRRRAFSARRGLDAPDRHPARERLAGVSRAGGERVCERGRVRPTDHAAPSFSEQPHDGREPLYPIKVLENDAKEIETEQLQLAVTCQSRHHRAKRAVPQTWHFEPFVRVWRSGALRASISISIVSYLQLVNAKDCLDKKQ